MSGAQLPFQILSIDGGGIRGVFAAAVLAAIEEDLGVVIADHFDLIAGTSTGGIIALGLGLGLRPKEIVDFYLSRGPAIFRNPIGMRSAQQYVRRKFSDVALVGALKDCYGGRLFGQSKKRLVIPSYNLGEDDVYIFRTPHHERLRRDWKLPAWKVGRSTSAAPTYFPCSHEVDGVRLVDGGVWANNPVMVALTEAVGTLEIQLDAIRILSIGSSYEILGRRRRLESGGLLAWGLGGAAVDVIMRGQNIGATNQARFLVGADDFERLDPPVPAKVFALDGHNRTSELTAKAKHFSRAFAPTFKAKFAVHQAPPFVPVADTGALACW